MGVQSPRAGVEGSCELSVGGTEKFHPSPLQEPYALLTAECLSSSGLCALDLIEAQEIPLFIQQHLLITSNKLFPRGERTVTVIEAYSLTAAPSLGQLRTVRRVKHQ